MISGEGLGPREGTGSVLGAGRPEGRPQTGARPEMAPGRQASGDEQVGEPREGSGGQPPTPRGRRDKAEAGEPVRQPGVGPRRCAPSGSEGTQAGRQVGQNAGEMIPQPGLGEERLAAPGAICGRMCAHVWCPGGGHAGPFPRRSLTASPLSYAVPPASGRQATAAAANVPGHSVSHRGDLWGCKAECVGGCPPRSVSG